MGSRYADCQGPDGQGCLAPHDCGGQPECPGYRSLNLDEIRARAETYSKAGMAPVIAADVLALLDRLAKAEADLGEANEAGLDLAGEILAAEARVAALETERQHTQDSINAYALGEELYEQRLAEAEAQLGIEESLTNQWMTKAEDLAARVETMEDTLERALERIVHLGGSPHDLVVDIAREALGW